LQAVAQAAELEEVVVEVVLYIDLHYLLLQAAQFRIQWALVVLLVAGILIQETLEHLPHLEH
jgi:hypothetical protein